MLNPDGRVVRAQPASRTVPEAETAVRADQPAAEPAAAAPKKRPVPKALTKAASGPSRVRHPRRKNLELKDLFGSDESVKITHEKIAEVCWTQGMMHGLECVYHLKVRGAKAVITIVWGSVADCTVGAIVNAANEGCTHGGGIDGVLNRLGGTAFQNER